ncbi:mitochondrion organization and biogenesis protein [Emericellopsis cladophorae]|uniref:Required for respiratory growth protein 9, mitochondrial n=1 Tax=Emericellopsis cladophorae TaxID=2686198 RepID=A0A9P9Y117_9HYPO|nr:mitochondrion organization and biogenesis protein [Emericellopsis cladophorae]KAI6781351.1 mitochondrion organization and biogenesis protein [Emericellopsis cladophorae]
MGCACRAVPLRSFITGLAQVHQVQTPFTTVVPRVRQAVITRQFRSTRPWWSDAQAPAPPREEAHAKQDDNDGAELHDELPTNITFERAQVEDAASDRHQTQTSKTEDSPIDADNEDVAPSSEHFDPSSASRNRQTARTPTTNRKLWQKDPPPKPEPLPPWLAKRPPPEPKQLPSWRVQKEALKEKFPEGWAPRKRLSPDAMAGIRALNAQFPDRYTSATLAERFEVSPEAIRRILKSKWQPSTEEEESRNSRWHKRGISVWERKAALGIKPPKKWRQEGVRQSDEYLARRKYAIKKEQEIDQEERAAYRAYLDSKKEKP